jgi:hypothetical protein
MVTRANKRAVTNKANKRPVREANKSEEERSWSESNKRRCLMTFARHMDNDRRSGERRDFAHVIHELIA